MSTVNLCGNAARFATATVEPQHGLVSVLLLDESSRMSFHLQLSADSAWDLAKALRSAILDFAPEKVECHGV